MKRFALWLAAAIAALQCSATFAGELGTGKEARAMLDRAVAEMKKDSNAAIAKFNKGEDGFRDRDLYVFCATPDGITTAHPTHVGTNLKTLKDKKGKAFGAEMFKVAREGRVSRVTYMWPKPGSDTPVAKVTYVTKVAHQICGVGYYK
ncbi:MAG TPA: cache domain-containing protein [Usitatibacter sp.]|nr:cache domain-containing protein [Usitatibacter sp.]